MQTATARFTPWQRFIIAALAVLGLAWLSFWLVRSRNANPMVSVTFLGYTNVDARGGWQPFTLAHFHVTNQGNATLTCGLDAVEFLSRGNWIQDTNRLSQQYGYILWTNSSVLVAVSRPPNTERLRAIFHVRHMLDRKQIQRQQKLELWLNRLGIHWQPKPPRPVIITCEAAAD